jgi:hypothetical protein
MKEGLLIETLAVVAVATARTLRPSQCNRFHHGCDRDALASAGLAALLGEEGCMDAKPLGRLARLRTQCWGLTRM